MFEVTTRLPNSFAFKNQPNNHNHSHNHQCKPTSSQVIRDHRITYPLPASASANSYRPMRHQMPIYFGQTNSASHPSESSFVSRSNPRVNISNPYFYEHNGTNSSSKPPLQVNPNPNLQVNLTPLGILYFKNYITKLSVRKKTLRSYQFITKAKNKEPTCLTLTILRAVHRTLDLHPM